MCPVLEMTALRWQDIQSRDELVFKCVGDRYDHLLNTLSVFDGYREWEEQKDYVFGYLLKYEYCIYSDSTHFSRYSMDELGEQNILTGMDMIVWRICKHFGFEMKKCLIYKDYNEADRYLIREFPAGTWSECLDMTWNNDEWHEAEWESMFGVQHLVTNDIAVFTKDGSDANAQAVFQIKCPPKY